METVGDQWKMIEYEVKMFYGTYKKLFTRSSYSSLPYVLKNALEESAVLHTRILCDVFLDHAKRPDDIALSHLLSGWPNDARWGNMRAMRDKLKLRYGKPNDPASPCRIFNKRLAHSTSHRGGEYDYRNILRELYPIIGDMIRELEFLAGRHFCLQFDGPTNPPSLFWA